MAKTASPASPDNVNVVSFADDMNAYEALTQLMELDAQRQAFGQDAASWRGAMTGASE